MEAFCRCRTIGIAVDIGHGQIPAMAFEMRISWLARASRRSRWLVGVSGGADSVALLHILAGAGFRNLVVCHLDHGLRGRASSADARFVGKLARDLGLPCECGRIDVRGRMKASGVSMETAAREARHEFFAACAKQFRCRRLLLAHHADDQAETALWNLLRGSRGLRGMREEHEIRVAGGTLRLIRPLLECRHAELVGWLEQRGLPWREDQSNSQPVAVRNRLRNEVIPLLAEISGRDPVPALVRAAADTLEIEACERDLVRQAGVLDPQGRLHLPVMRTLPVTLQRAALRGFLEDHGIASIDRALLERGLALMDPAAAAAVNLPGGGRLRRGGGRLWIDR